MQAPFWLFKIPEQVIRSSDLMVFEAGNRAIKRSTPHERFFAWSHLCPSKFNSCHHYEHCWILILTLHQQKSPLAIDKSLFGSRNSPHRILPCKRCRIGLSAWPVDDCPPCKWQGWWWWGPYRTPRHRPQPSHPHLPSERRVFQINLPFFKASLWLTLQDHHFLYYFLFWV